MSMVDVPEFNVGQLKDLREDIESLVFHAVSSCEDDLTESASICGLADTLATKLINKFVRRLRPDVQAVWEEAYGR